MHCGKKDLVKTKTCDECKEKLFNKCPDCGIFIRVTSKRCIDCATKLATRPDRIVPDRQTSNEEFKTHTLTELSEKYKMTINAIKKRLKREKVFKPVYHRSERYNLKKLYDEYISDKFLTIKDLAKKYNMNNKTLSVWLKKEENRRKKEKEDGWSDDDNDEDENSSWSNDDSDNDDNNDEENENSNCEDESISSWSDSSDEEDKKDD